MTLSETLTKKRQILNLYYTAGYPCLDSTLSTAEHLEKAGADILEIGIPYSDPIADGSLIQQSNQTALANGMSLPTLLGQIQNIKKYVQIPIILMGYFNPILQFGIPKFIDVCQNIGIEAVIIPDLPMEEYQEHYQKDFEKANISLIFLMTPQTSTQRMQVIDGLTRSFIYAVSSNTITGKSSMLDSGDAYFLKIQNAQLKSPILVGFGIKNYQTFRYACQHTQGAIVGSALIKQLPNLKTQDDFDQFVRSIKYAT